MDSTQIIVLSTIISIVVTVVGAIVNNAIALYKARPERNKLEAESGASMADAAESIAGGAKISNDLLLKRIEELDERDQEREKKFVKMQNEFDRVRLELNEWQDWARRLAHQVKSLGHEPVAFKPILKE